MVGNNRIANCGTFKGNCMATKKKKPRPGSIAARKEELRNLPKKKSVSSMIDESMRPSKSFKESLAIVGTLAGPGKFGKAGKVAKEISGKVSKDAATRLGKKRIIQSEKNIRAKTTEATRKSRADKIRAEAEKAFDPGDMAKAAQARKQAVVTKEAAKKLTKRRKDTSKKNVAKVAEFKKELTSAQIAAFKVRRKAKLEKALRRVENRLRDRKNK